eukprot:3807643-Prymnesium_polylepis.1
MRHKWCVNPASSLALIFFLDSALRCGAAERGWQRGCATRTEVGREGALRAQRSVDGARYARNESYRECATRPASR